MVVAGSTHARDPAASSPEPEERAAPSIEGAASASVLVSGVIAVVVIAVILLGWFGRSVVVSGVIIMVLRGRAMVVSGMILSIAVGVRMVRRRQSQAAALAPSIGHYFDPHGAAIRLLHVLESESHQDGQLIGIGRLVSHQPVLGDADQRRVD